MKKYIVILLSFCFILTANNELMAQKEKNKKKGKKKVEKDHKTKRDS